jgi:hypothetical protein
VKKLTCPVPPATLISPTAPVKPVLSHFNKNDIKYYHLLSNIINPSSLKKQLALKM